MFDSAGGALSDGVGASAAPSVINCQGRSVGGVPMSDRRDATLRTPKVFEENKDQPLSWRRPRHQETLPLINFN